MSNSIIPQSGDNAPLIFRFAGIDIRVIKQEGFEPLFYAADLCKALDLGNISKALAALPNEEKGITKSDTLGGAQNQLVVTEQGMYRLVFRSNKPEAEAFRKWVFYEVLPAIRETGSYTAPTKELSPIEYSRHLINSLVAIQDTMETMQGEIREVKQDIAEVRALVQPEVEYFTVLGYCRKMGLPPPSQNEAQSIGIRAAKLSRDRGLSIGNTSDARYGTVHTYHVSILEAIVKH